MIKLPKLKFDKISMKSGDNMIRVGVGLHKGRWFFRIDLWSTGYRITKQLPIE